ncbi:MAG TPA: hypothetical protein VF788_07095 [Pseudonocardiaceae bacterium]
MAAGGVEQRGQRHPANPDARRDGEFLLKRCTCPPGPTAASPGCGRTEVAARAGVSIEYYCALGGVSASVLDAIARTPQLDDDERAHLFDLARAADGSSALLRPRHRRQKLLQEPGCSTTPQHAARARPRRQPPNRRHPRDHAHRPRHAAEPDARVTAIARLLGSAPAPSTTTSPTCANYAPPAERAASRRPLIAERVLVRGCSTSGDESVDQQEDQ